MWDWAIDDAIAQGATGFVGLGDVVEGDPDGEERYALCARYRRMRRHGPVIEVLGNHESRPALRFLEFLDITVAWDEFLLTSLDSQAALLAMPYARKGYPPYYRPDHEPTIHTIEAGNRTMADEMRSAIALVRSRVHVPLIVAGHWTVAGARLGDSDVEIHASQEMIVPVDAFEGADLVISGHIHLAQEIPPNIVYAGSLYRCSFAEMGDPKSYVLVTVEDGHVRWERQPVPAREQAGIVLNWTPDWRPPADLSPYAGTEVKLIVEVPADRVGAFDPSVFEPLRAAAALFELDKRIESFQRVRAPEIVAMQTLPEQFFAWTRAHGIDLDESRRQRLQAKLASMT
jgi:hypothetical protein